jgi:hypothetical protein
MSAETIPELEHLTLRVLEEYDEEAGAWVARCLETGAVASARDQSTLQALMRETIQLEILLAVKKDNFPNLFRSPASGKVWAKWLRVAGMPNALSEDTLEINISLMTPRREVKSEIGIQKASFPRTA